MLFFFDFEMVCIDLFCVVKMLNINFFVYDLFILELYFCDLCNIVCKVENYLISIGIVDIVYFGVEVEFYIFDLVSFDLCVNGFFYEVDVILGWWNIGVVIEVDGSFNWGYKVCYKGGYFLVVFND